jgi:hypothetical protein
MAITALPMRTIPKDLVPYLMILFHMYLKRKAPIYESFN